ncbi:MAG: DNA-directed RNA polymerase, subunit E'' [Candidatus Methanospirare jalkutatii]|nr:DNA-directed RNA polymerase, subunit E'' [Methanophagales archaeon]MCU4140488.1 RNA polymerase subunit RPABC4/transcription elongation factor Spt4 [Methanophagales archaeon]MCW3132462.1 DNA-directed RNA polymerase, subunit E'' [Candidatus Methanospirare jalkutatii]MCW7075562.1 DNA-directed RNA polymerase, subunit E'' [Candidatus Methanospirare jalkutatii]MCW7079924.1 DNA-directed RNA polymerase, subunit E'' [Candidatus Methanospirare jalkutatii]
MEWACKDCHRIFRDTLVCKCGSSAISKEWSGYVIILDAKNSEIAKKLGIKEEGRYALKVR